MASQFPADGVDQRERADKAPPARHGVAQFPDFNYLQRLGLGLCQSGALVDDNYSSNVGQRSAILLVRLSTDDFSPTRSLRRISVPKSD
jgi:hypothetical protein